MTAALLPRRFERQRSAWVTLNWLPLPARIDSDDSISRHIAVQT